MWGVLLVFLAGAPFMPVKSLDGGPAADFLSVFSADMKPGSTLRLPASGYLTDNPALKQRRFNEDGNNWTITRRELGYTGYGGQFAAWNDCEFIRRDDRRWLVCGRAGGHMDAGLSDAFSFALHEARGWVRVLNPRPLDCEIETGDPKWPEMRAFDQNDYACKGKTHDRFMPNMGHTYGSRTHDPATGRTFEIHIAPFPGSGSNPVTWRGNLAALFDWNDMTLDAVNTGPHPYLRPETKGPRTGFLVNTKTGGDESPDIDNITRWLPGRFPATCLLPNGQMLVWSRNTLFYYEMVNMEIADIAAAPFTRSWGTISCYEKRVVGFSAKWSSSGTHDRIFQVELDDAYRPVSHRLLTDRQFPEGSQIVHAGGSNYVYTGGALQTYDFAHDRLADLHVFPDHQRSYKKMFYDQQSGALVIARREGVWVHKPANN